MVYEVVGSTMEVHAPEVVYEVVGSTIKIGFRVVVCRSELAHELLYGATKATSMT